MSLEQASKLFGARPTSFAPDLSPNGDKLVYLFAGPGASTVAIVKDLSLNTEKALLRSTGKPDQLYWCAFADERWVICRFGGQVKSGGMIFGVGRTMAVDTTNGATHRLGSPSSTDGDAFVQFDGKIIDWLPDAQGKVLMQRAYPRATTGADLIGVDEIQIDPFRIQVVEPANSEDVNFMTDGHGSVRIRSDLGADENNLLTGKTSYYYRTKAGKKWLRLPENDPDFTPLVVDQSLDSLYFLKPLKARSALYRIKLDGSNAETLIASNPDVDIDTVIQFGPGQPVAGYRYTDDRTRSVYTSAPMQALGKALASALPNLPLINFVGASRDAIKVLLHAGSDVDPGSYFLLDRQKRRMEPVLNSSDVIDGTGLAPMKAVSIPTADGQHIPAYLTMRDDLGSGPHPFIMLPHGGPSDRDAWGFDWLTQFLAARGYVVLQPNYRGSSGYGKDFLGENAFKGWRKVMSDIHDSTDWGIKQGLADPNRMAIVGWSYGGYAALQSATLDPRYKAVVAVAPVTDLKQLRRDAQGFREEKLNQDEIGKGSELVEGSPIRHAADIRAPVLMVHGTLDANVAFDHSKRMLAALRGAGKTADLLTFEGLDHQLDDSNVRVQMLSRIGELLDRTIATNQLSNK
ncbi:alpha/beta hydrolase family protein [Sphingomonas sp. RB1R13]|uniref:alpha/beta hydrolase family protein n=1 Tax=Sphingomonas sp. RB1R13 TaxID=3096159 RepID=UPI002FCB7A31